MLLKQLLKYEKKKFFDWGLQQKSQLRTRGGEATLGSGRKGVSIKKFKGDGGCL